MKTLEESMEAIVAKSNKDKAEALVLVDKIFACNTVFKDLPMSFLNDDGELRFFLYSNCIYIDSRSDEITRQKYTICWLSPHKDTVGFGESYSISCRKKFLCIFPYNSERYIRDFNKTEMLLLLEKKQLWSQFLADNVNFDRIIKNIINHVENVQAKYKKIDKKEELIVQQVADAVADSKTRFETI